MDWHYVSNNQNVGPVSLDELRLAAQSGRLRPDALVWNASLPQWVPAHTVPELGLAPQGQSVLAYDAPEIGQAVVTDHAYRLFGQAKPWIRFLSVMCYIFAGIMIVAGLFIVSVGRGVLPPAMILMYVALAVLYMIPGLLLGRYASSISSLLAMRRSDHLEHALDAHRALFRTVGIMVITVMVLYFVGAVLVGIFAR
jgi:hypothetical protein